ncbi:MFS transporter [candidate division KSB1 bacterium]|nr:MFS transporter [candidate division KSB1 bacterium]
MNTTNQPGERRLYLDRNLQIIFGVTLMAIMGVSSIAPVFPRIIKELEISPKSVGMLITFFTFPGILLTPVLGVLADRYGRKIILIPSLLMFASAGTACFFVRDFNILLLLRFLQGAGAASLGSLYAIIIGDLYSGRDRAVAMGYNSSVLSIGTATFPLIGGALASLGWYYPFLLPGLGFVVALAALKLINPEPDKHESLRHYFLQIFSVLRQFRLVCLFIAGLSIFIVLYGVLLTYFPIFLNSKFNSSPFLIGLVMSAMSFSTAVTSSQMGFFTRRFSEYTLLKLSFIITAVAIAIVPMVRTFGLAFLPVIIYGVGHGLAIPSLLSLLASLPPMQVRGAVLSMNGTILRLGQTAGPFFMGLALGLSGLSATFWTGALVLLLTATFLIVTCRGRWIRG